MKKVNHRDCVNLMLETIVGFFIRIFRILMIKFENFSTQFFLIPVKEY